MHIGNAIFTVPCALYYYVPSVLLVQDAVTSNSSFSLKVVIKMYNRLWVGASKSFEQVLLKLF